MSKPLTKEEVEEIVRETINGEFGRGPRLAIWFGGSQTYKALGRHVADALLHSPVVVIDGRMIRSIAGRKPMWKA